MGLRTPKVYINNDGAICVKLTNKTGANSVRGESVEPSTANDFAVIQAASNDINPLGTFLESGVADGSEAWIAIDGIAPARTDATGATRGNWAGSSATAGRVDGSVASPPSTTVHFQEMGHWLDAVAANGTGSIICHHN